LRHSSPHEKGEIVETFNSADPSDKMFDDILDLMHRHGSIEYAFSMARGYVEKALDFLAPFAPSIHKTALRVVADYVVSRDH